MPVKSTALECYADCANASPVEETAKEIGRRIAALRAGKGWTVQALASEVDVSRNAVMAWEKGTSVPDTIRLVRLADIFHVSLDQIVGRAPIARAHTADLATRVSDLEGDMVQVLQRNEFADQAILALLDALVMSEKLRPLDAQRLQRMLEQLRSRTAH